LLALDVHSIDPACPQFVNSRGDRRSEPADDYTERLVQVRRVTKVVKGGKQLSFRAVVVVGDGKGSVGVGCASAKEVLPSSHWAALQSAACPLLPWAHAAPHTAGCDAFWWSWRGIGDLQQCRCNDGATACALLATQIAQSVQRAVAVAKREKVTFPLNKAYSLPHRIDGYWGAAKVMLRPAADGAGVIAGECLPPPSLLLPLSVHTPCWTIVHWIEVADLPPPSQQTAPCSHASSISLPCCTQHVVVSGACT
jgi:ribosomal protein S5